MFCKYGQNKIDGIGGINAVGVGFKSGITVFR